MNARLGPPGHGSESSSTDRPDERPDETDDEGDVPLAGGHMGPVVRRGDTVLRAAGVWTPAVHRLLDHCRDAGFDAAPRAYGVLPDGREQLGFVPGECPAYPLPRWVWGEAALVSSARLLAAYHAVAATADREGPWRSPVRQPVEVVCHNDSAPYNMTYRVEPADDAGQASARAIGLIDFDYAAPGPRIWDVAYLAQRLAPLTTDRADGFDDRERLDRVRRLLEAYGTPASSWSLVQVLEVVAARLDHLAGFSDEKAVELGNPDLHEHANLYRRDIDYVQGLVRLVDTPS